MIKEFIKVEGGCEECFTIFKKGDLVHCLVDPLYLTDSVFDCGKYIKDIGVITEVTFFKQYFGEGIRFDVICELGIHWANADVVSYHLDKYISHLGDENGALQITKNLGPT
jgi:hypothetical protein